MRFLFAVFLLCFLFVPIFAEEIYLPESANPKTYQKISECYARDDITFYTSRGGILGDWKNWKNIKILEDGCFAKIGNQILFAGQYFGYWDHSKNETITVTPDNSTFQVVKFQSGVFLWLDKNYIFHGNVALDIPTGFDITKMKYLPNEYMTDGKELYFIGSVDGSILRIEGIDIASFWVFVSPMGQRFLYDKHGVYNDRFVATKHRTEDDRHIAYMNMKELKSYPTHDFQTLTESGAFVFDSKNVYSPVITVLVDMSTFWLFPDERLARDQNHIYTPTGKTISGVNIWNYIYIWNGVIRSRWKLFVWCRSEVGCDGYELTGFDVSTFQKTPSGFADKNGYYDLYFNSTKKPKIDIFPYTGSSSYFHNSENVFLRWWGDEYSVLTGATIQGFVAFSGTLYATESGSCWFEGSRFPCSSKTFRVIEPWRALDAMNVYYQSKKIIGADPKSFTGIDTGGFNWIETDHYMRDKNRIYYDDRVIKNSDPNTFVLMKDIHAKDKRNIYYAWWKVEWADYKTYTPLRWSFARDRNHFYFAGISLQQIKNPKAVKIISRDSLSYNGKTRPYWCFASKKSSTYPACNE